MSQPHCDPQSAPIVAAPEPMVVLAGGRRACHTRPGPARRVIVTLVVGYFAVIVLAPLVMLVAAALTARSAQPRPLLRGATPQSKPPVGHPACDPYDGLFEEPIPGQIAEGLADSSMPGLWLWQSRWALALTVTAALAAVAVNTVMGTLVAWVLVRQRGRWRVLRLLNALVDLPFAVSPVVAGYMLLLLYGRGGWLAAPVEALGLPVAFSPLGVVMATVLVSLPFVVRELVPILDEQGTEAQQAAITLGASPWQTFWYVTLPGLRWGLLYGAALTAARALGEYGAVAVVGGAVAGHTETATLWIDRQFLDRHEPAALGMALLLMGLAVGLMVGLERLAGPRRRPPV